MSSQWMDLIIELTIAIVNIYIYNVLYAQIVLNFRHYVPSLINYFPL